MKEIWDLGMLQVFLSNTGMTTGRPCLFSSSVCADSGEKERKKQNERDRQTDRLLFQNYVKVFRDVFKYVVLHMLDKEVIHV